MDEIKTLRLVYFEAQKVINKIKHLGVYICSIRKHNNNGMGL